MKDLFTPADPSEVEGSQQLSDQSSLTNDDVDYFEALVGEGKKYRDNKALAKSVVHKDKHIETIEAENRRLRQENETRMSLEEFYKKTKENTQQHAVTSNQQAPTNSQGERTQVENASEIKPLTQVELQNLVREALKDESSKLSRERNINETRKSLIGLYGPGFDKVVQEKADELGLDPSFINELAATSPKAVVSLFGGGTKREDTNAFLPPSTTRTSPVSNVRANSGVRDQAYYENIRKTNPKQYWSTATQAQKHRDAIALGEKFFTSGR